jgi:glycerol uptake facilitator-like aquaporin
MKLCGKSRLGAMASAALVSGLAFTNSVLAQSPPPPPEPPANPTSGGNLANFVFHAPKTSIELWLTLLIIAFGLTVLGIYIYAVRNIPDRRPEDVSRPLIVIAVITAALILITAGYTNEQIAPAFGLFGTIVGYMLGRMSPPGPGAAVETPPHRAAPKEGEK